MTHCYFGAFENKEARKRLLKKGVDVQVARKDRFISPGALGHNKFLVRTDKKGKPISVWTGSTNWAPTGLCTQVNNGILIENPRSPLFTSNNGMH